MKFKVGDRVREYWPDGSMRLEGVITPLSADALLIKDPIVVLVTKVGDSIVGARNCAIASRRRCVRLIPKKAKPISVEEKPKALPNVYTSTAKWLHESGTTVPVGSLASASGGRARWSDLVGKKTRLTIEVLE